VAVGVEAQAESTMAATNNTIKTWGTNFFENMNESPIDFYLFGI
jgi:hypothetical protein